MRTSPLGFQASGKPRNSDLGFHLGGSWIKGGLEPLILDTSSLGFQLGGSWARQALASLEPCTLEFRLGAKQCDGAELTRTNVRTGQESLKPFPCHGLWKNEWTRFRKR